MPIGNARIASLAAGLHERALGHRLASGPLSPGVPPQPVRSVLGRRGGGDSRQPVETSTTMSSSTVTVIRLASSSAVTIEPDPSRRNTRRWQWDAATSSRASSRRSPMSWRPTAWACSRRAFRCSRPPGHCGTRETTAPSSLACCSGVEHRSASIRATTISTDAATERRRSGRRDSAPSGASVTGQRPGGIHRTIVWPHGCDVEPTGVTAGCRLRWLLSASGDASTLRLGSGTMGLWEAIGPADEIVGRP
jgi:hypothetical protein